MLAPEEEEVVQADNIPPEVLAGRQVQIGINPLSPRSKQRAEQVLLVHPVWQLMRCGWCQEVVGEEQNAAIASCPSSKVEVTIRSDLASAWKAASERCDMALLSCALNGGGVLYRSRVLYHFPSNQDGVTDWRCRQLMHLVIVLSGMAQAKGFRVTAS